MDALLQQWLVDPELELEGRILNCDEAWFQFLLKRFEKVPEGMIKVLPAMRFMTECYEQGYRRRLQKVGNKVVKEDIQKTRVARLDAEPVPSGRRMRVDLKREAESKFKDMVVTRFRLQDRRRFALLVGGETVGEYHFTRVQQHADRSEATKADPHWEVEFELMNRPYWKRLSSKVSAHRLLLTVKDLLIDRAAGDVPLKWRPGKTFSKPQMR